MNTKNYTLGLDMGDRRSTSCLLDAEDALATSLEGCHAPAAVMSDLNRR